MCAVCVCCASNNYFGKYFGVEKDANKYAIFVKCFVDNPVASTVIMIIVYSTFVKCNFLLATHYMKQSNLAHTGAFSAMHNCTQRNMNRWIVRAENVNDPICER